MRKLGRKTDHRLAMLKNLATDLVVYEEIKTTEKRAKELRSYVEKLVTKAKRANANPGEHQAPKNSKNKKSDNQRDPLGANQLHAYRQIAKKVIKTKALAPVEIEGHNEYEVPEINVVLKIIDDLAIRFKDTNGGYTKVIKFGPRRGDGAETAVIKFTK